MTRLVPERDVRKAIRGWLDAHKIPHVAVEPIRPFIKDGQVRFRTEQARDKGCADFVALLPILGRPTRYYAVGWVRPVAIEAKSSTGKQSPAQREWQAWWECCGFTYILARSVEDIENAWPK